MDIESIPSGLSDTSFAWKMLSSDDKNEYYRLKQAFFNSEKKTSKDSRVLSFSKELQMIQKYISRSVKNVDYRCLIVGVCFIGDIICINNRQLKVLVNRCKSSINGCLANMGFIAMSNKAKAKKCVISAIPILQNYQLLLKQWTSRCATDKVSAKYGYSMEGIEIPKILKEDLFQDKRIKSTNVQHHTPCEKQNTTIIPTPKPIPSIELETICTAPLISSPNQID